MNVIQDENQDTALASWISWMDVTQDPAGPLLNGRYSGCPIHDTKRLFMIFRMVIVLTALLGDPGKSWKVPGFDNPAAPCSNVAIVHICSCSKRPLSRWGGIYHIQEKYLACLRGELEPPPTRIPFMESRFAALVRRANWKIHNIFRKLESDDGRQISEISLVYAFRGAESIIQDNRGSDNTSVEAFSLLSECLGWDLGLQWIPCVCPFQFYILE